MREPPDKTTVKEPLSLVNLSERSAVYLANSAARSSLESNTWTFFSEAIRAAADEETALQESFSLLEEVEREREREWGLEGERGSSDGLAWRVGEY